MAPYGPFTLNANVRSKNMNTRRSKWGILAVILSAALHGMAGLPGNWEIRPSSVTRNLNGLATAPGQLVAVGQAGVILASYDGVNWARAAFAPATGDFHCATFGKGLYVAGGTLGCLMAISSDGVNWTSIETSTGIHANFGVTFARGRFVVVGRGTSPVPNCRLLTSTNGIDWDTVVRPTTNTLRAITFGNGQYVAVGERGTIVTSADAITWTVQFSGTEHHLRSVIFTGREFLAGGDSSTLLTSGDGISWLTVPFSSFDVRGLASSGTAVVAVGGLGTGGRVQSSIDGLSWPGSATTLSAVLNAVVQFDLGRFIAVGNSGLIIDSTAWADTPVNVWTNIANGYWHENFWSLGHLPSWKDRSIVFTNAGNKTLEIDVTTPRDYPDSMLINELILDAPGGSHNTVSLNNVGLELPLLINSALRVPHNVSLLNVNSALEAPRLDLSGTVSLENGHFLFRDLVNVGSMGVWNQFGGTHDAGTLILGGESVYNLHQGTLTTSNTTLAAGSSDFIQTGGEHHIENELDIRGIYEFRDGGLIFRTIRLQGELHLNRGWNRGVEIAFHGGILKVNLAHVFVGLGLPSNGTIDFQHQSANLGFQFIGTWSGTLSLINWTPGVDKFVVGDGARALSAEQLTHIRFINPDGFPPGIYSARTTSNGEVVPVPRIAYQRGGGNNLVLTWPQGYRLLSATNVAGPYSPLTNTISPYTASYTDPQRFFIIRNEN
jgi:hypothetical protein